MKAKNLNKKTMTTIQVNEDIKVRLQTKNTGSNYNLFASVYVKGEKMPVIGTIFKENTSHSVIKIWATENTDCLYHYERLDNL